MHSQHPTFVIGIGGGDGAGKSDVTERLCRAFEKTWRVSVLNQDSYYSDPGTLRVHDKQDGNFDNPASVNHDLWLSDLGKLIAGTQVQKPQYCFGTHTRGIGFDLVLPAPIIVIQGTFALWDSRLRNLMNYKVYVDTDPDLRFIRRLCYDVQNRGRTLGSVITQYLTSSRPMHQLYVEPTKVYADRVVNNSESIEQTIIEIEQSATEILRNCRNVNLRPNTPTLTLEEETALI